MAQSTTEPASRLEAELTALAVEWVAAHRARVSDPARTDGLLPRLQRLLDGHPDRVSWAVGYLLEQLAGLAADVAEKWDLEAFPMTPGTRLLTAYEAQAAEERARHGA